MSSIGSRSGKSARRSRTVAIQAATGILLSGGVCQAETAQPLALVPQPAALEIGEGSFLLTADAVIVADSASRATAEQLAAALRPATGFALRVARRGRAGRQVIALSQDNDLLDLGSEGYLLTVTPERVDLTAPTQAGLFYAAQTLRQLFPPAIFGASAVPHTAWEAPCVRIKDAPRFGWRGLMLDTGHDFQEFPFVLRFIDLMALHKFNTLHWHITDLGTWPLEIKGHPELLDPATRGTRRRGNPERGVKPGYYTQEQVRQAVRYAAERHITVVPEIDMPGHSTPALIAYPELDCPPPNTSWDLERWEYCVGNEKTYAFLQDVLGQVIELFPSRFIHIGGDECPKDHWKKCPVCQAKMRAENLKDEEELQSYFVKRIEAFLNAKGRRLIGWDEILEGGLAPNAAVMAWRGTAGGITAARAGHDVVMAPTSHTYFDYPYSTTPVDKVYSFEPIPPELGAEQTAHILGAQAQMWTDNHPTDKEIEQLVYPRACALAEVVWSPAAVRDFSRFAASMATHEQRLAALNVNFLPLAQAQSGAAK